MATKATAPTNFKRNRSFVSDSGPRKTITFTWTKGSLGSGTTFYGYGIYYKKSTDTDYNFLVSTREGINTESLTLDTETLSASVKNDLFDNTVTLAIRLVVCESGYSSDWSNTVTVKFNTRPTINFKTGNEYTEAYGAGKSEPYTSRHSTGVYENSKGFYVGAYSYFNNINKTGTLKLSMEFCPGDASNRDIGTDSFSALYEYHFSDVNITSSIASNGYIDLTSTPYSANGALKNGWSDWVYTQQYYMMWRMKATLNDGTENSEAVYFPSNGYFTIPNAPTTEEVTSYNDFNGNSVSGTNLLWKKVSLKYPRDGSARYLKSVTAKVNNISYECNATYTDSTTTDMATVNITLPDNIPSNANIVFTINYTNGADSLQKRIVCSKLGNNGSSSINLKKATIPTLNINNDSILSIQPYTSNSEYNTATVVIDNPFGTYTRSQCAVANDVAPILSLKNNNTTWNVGSTWANNSQTFQYNLQNNPLAFSTFVGTRNIDTYIQITNLFGETFTSPIKKTQFKFDELITIDKDEPFKILYKTNLSDSTWLDLGTSRIQEGLYLRFQPKIRYSSFTFCEIRVGYRFGNSGAYTYYGTQTMSYSPQTMVAPSPAQAGEHAYDVNIHFDRTVPVGEINQATNVWFSLKITTDAGSTISVEKSCEVIRQTAPTISFDSFQVSRDVPGQVEYSFNVSDNGISPTTTPPFGTTTYYFNFDGALSTNSISPGTAVTTSIDPSLLNWQQKNISIRTVSVITSSDAILSGDDYAKEFDSAPLQVFAASPVISVRPDYVKIFDTTIASDSVTLPERTKVTPYYTTETLHNWNNYYTDSHPYFTRSGNVVTFDWTAVPTDSATIGGTAVTICTIPSGFRPVAAAYNMILGRQNLFTANLGALPGGDVRITYVRSTVTTSAAYATITSNDWFRIHMVWITNDAHPSTVNSLT